MSGEPHAPPIRLVDLLRAELLRRSARNRRYSLRAYANFLGIDPATLSQLLRGRRACTPRTVRRLGLRLGLDEAQLTAFVAAESAATGLESGLRDAEELMQDTVGLAGEWYHYAILELALAADFEPDSRRMAATLGITVDEVNVALQRLARLGLLEMQGARWTVRSQHAATAQAFTLAALRRCHELLGRLIDAAEQRAPDRAKASPHSK